jgi:hypothetical protein
MGQSGMTKELQEVLNDDAEQSVAYAGARRLELASAVLDELRVRYPTTPVFGEIR